MAKINLPLTPINEKPMCAFCKKEVFCVAKIQYVVGCEKPVVLHTICYERLIDGDR